MIGWLKSIFNLILPPRCLICGKEVSSDNSLCSECFSHINFISFPFCQRCGKPFDISMSNSDLLCPDCLHKRLPFRLCRSAVVYDENSKKLILDFKFFDHLENKYLLANWLLLAGKDIFDNGVDLIIPVPLHFSRLLKRKYNQSAVLCDALSKLTHIPANYKALKKVRHTRPQVSCNGKQRLHNVRGAFEVVLPEMIKDKRIVLVDDVFTTGSTLKECAKILKKAGAKSVDTLTIARVCD